MAPQRQRDLAIALTPADPNEDPLALLKRQPIRRIHDPPTRERRLIANPLRRGPRHAELHHHLHNRSAGAKPRHDPRPLTRLQQPIPPTHTPSRTHDISALSTRNTIVLRRPDESTTRDGVVRFGSRRRLTRRCDTARSRAPKHDCCRYHTAIGRTTRALPLIECARQCGGGPDGHLAAPTYPFATLPGIPCSGTAAGFTAGTGVTSIQLLTDHQDICIQIATRASGRRTRCTKPCKPGIPPFLLLHRSSHWGLRRAARERERADRDDVVPGDLRAVVGQHQAGRAAARQPPLSGWWNDGAETGSYDRRVAGR